MPDNVARSIIGAHGEGNKQHADFVPHRLQSTAVAFHAPIKMNKIHLPGNRHCQIPQQKQACEQHQGIQAVTKATIHECTSGKGIVTACLKSRMLIVNRPYPNMAS